MQMIADRVNKNSGLRASAPAGTTSASKTKEKFTVTGPDGLPLNQKAKLNANLMLVRKKRTKSRDKMVSLDKIPKAPTVAYGTANFAPAVLTDDEDDHNFSDYDEDDEFDEKANDLNVTEDPVDEFGQPVFPTLNPDEQRILNYQN